MRYGLVERKPAEHLREVLAPREKGHFAAIGPDGLPEFLRALNANEACMGLPVRVAMRLMLLVFVRTSEMRDPKRPMSNNALLKALERMGYKGDMTGHGFRSLAMSTLKEQLGYRHEVVDRQLAHAQKDRLESAYDRASYLEERRAMMQRWADYLDEVTVASLQRRDEVRHVRTERDLGRLAP